ncbi:NAD-dependent succinate-semialdehyde dehydrogenase [Paraburkholderia sp. 22B1P]|uniref:NAD-dependent succinate-semialdehyde dehydrogenase n=1 Tax=Paraburkholderia sp. 22B1P TaxID=3080498 RepID=UPI00308540DD|nr:NAD-dependent succinate-semialdehyde dehydrogenase [Paraburkholderia sp. 22B1P]
MIYQTINPATGKLIKTFPTISNGELEEAISRAHSIYKDDWRQRPVVERARILARAAAIMQERADELARIVTEDMGKLLLVATMEVSIAAGILDYYAKNAAAFLEPKQIAGYPGAALVTEPIGVILAIEPWNFPYYQIARVAGPQLMAGNVVFLKQAESVPQAALAFEQVLREAGAPEGAYTNIFASHEQISHLIADQRVAGVTLTGSERAGSAIAEQAGRHLKKVVMELGGSDAFIVLPDAPLDHAVESAVFGRMFNCGQSCIASKRIIVVGKDRGAAFVEKYIEQVKALKAGDPLDPATSFPPMSSERAMNTILEQVAAAKAAGADVLLGGNRIDRPGFFVEPTVITNIDGSNPVYRQELFGPVATIYVVDSEDEAVRIANDTPYGLGGSVYGADLDRARRVAARIESGMVFINQPVWTAPEMPFGGVKNSGFGRESSEMGFGEFVNHKLIHLAPAGAPVWGEVPLDANK